MIIILVDKVGKNDEKYDVSWKPIPRPLPHTHRDVHWSSLKVVHNVNDKILSPLPLGFFT